MKKRWVYWANRFGVAVALLLMGAILWSSAAQLRELDWKKFLIPSLIGIAIYGVSLALQAWLWIVLVAKMTGVSAGWWDMKVYMSTHFMRRIPGAPWYMAGRVASYREQGRSGMAALAASLVEWGGFLATALVWLAIYQWGWAGVLGSALGIAIIILPWAWLRKLCIFPRRLKPFLELPRRWIFSTCIVYIFVWLLGGTILYLLIVAAQPESGLEFLHVMAIWALGGGVSLLAVMAPAGFGVREFSITFLLQPYLGPAIALVIALLLRVLFTVGDFTWGSSLWFISKRFCKT